MSSRIDVQSQFETAEFVDCVGQQVGDQAQVVIDLIGEWATPGVGTRPTAGRRKFVGDQGGQAREHGVMWDDG